MTVHEDLGSRRGNIWWVVAAPLTWALHFLISYITAAIYCAKYVDQEASIEPITIPVAAYTIVALSVIVSVATVGYRRHRLGETTTPHSKPTRGDQVRMIGLATFLLSLLSGIATLFTALVFVLAGSCH